MQNKLKASPGRQMAALLANLKVPSLSPEKGKLGNLTQKGKDMDSWVLILEAHILHSIRPIMISIKTERLLLKHSLHSLHIYTETLMLRAK